MTAPRTTSRTRRRKGERIGVWYIDRFGHSRCVLACGVILLAGERTDTPGRWWWRALLSGLLLGSGSSANEATARGDATRGASAWLRSAADVVDGVPEPDGVRANLQGEPREVDRKQVFKG